MKETGGTFCDAGGVYTPDSHLKCDLPNLLVSSVTYPDNAPLPLRAQYVQLVNYSSPISSNSDHSSMITLLSTNWGADD